MSQERFRQKYGHDPFRAWMRKEFPNGKEGFVPGDIDHTVQILRTYGPGFDSDRLGTLMCIEKKEYGAGLTNGQTMIYQFISKMASDFGFARERFRGCHVIEIIYSGESPVCDKCQQEIQDEETAYKRFKSAKLKWDGKEITHDNLKCELWGIGGRS